MAFLNNLISAIRKRTLDKTNIDEKIGDTIRGIKTGFQEGVQRVKEQPIKDYVLFHPDTFSQASSQGAQTLRQIEPYTQKARQMPEKEGIVDDYFRTAGNFSSNMLKSLATGLEDVSQGIQKKSVPGAFQAIRGGSRVALNATPIGFGANVASSLDKPVDQNDRVRRAASGLYRGMNLDNQNQLAQNVPQRKTQIKTPVGNVEFDPLVEGGKMVGFTQNPFNKTIFGLSSKYFPAEGMNFVSRIAQRFTRGGLENIALAMADIPEDPVEKAKFMFNEFIWGGASENLAGLGEEGQIAFKRFVDAYGAKGIKGLAEMFTGAKKEATKVVEKQTGEKVQNIMRRIKVTNMGVPEEDMLVPEARVLRRGTNQFDQKYKDFVPAGSTAGYKSNTRLVQDPNDPSKFYTRPLEEVNAMGGVAGFEQDEEGKYRYNPQKGALGIVGATVGKKAIDSLRPSELTSELDSILGKTEADINLKAGEVNPTTELDSILGKTETPQLTAGQTPLPLPEGTYTAKTADEARSLIRTLGSQGRLGSAKVGIEENILKPNTKPVMAGAHEMMVKDAKQARALQKQFPNAKISLKPNEDVIRGLAPDNGERTQLSEIEKIIYGSSTPEKADLGGKKEGVGFASNLLRKGQEVISTKVGDLTTSTNPIVRNTARLLQGFSGGLGKSSDYMEKSAGYKGTIDYGNKIANDTQRFVAEKVGNSSESLKRMHAVLDPELADNKLKFEDLTPEEQEATGVLQKVSDYINDTNYKNGFITKEKWNEGRGGKYLARAYEDYDFPPEIADFQKQRDLKFDLNPFKKREGVTDWKKENAIRDPSYLVAKRLQQTVFNDEVGKMSRYLSSQPNLTSDIPQAGFEQLSDHKAWGDLAGKYVRKDIVDDIKGFHFSNDGVQKMYDVLNWYDKNPLRRARKQVLTVFNPAVRLGNKTGNYVFAWMSGINPVAFKTNRAWAKKAISGNDELYRRMIKDGLIGGDAMRSDIQRFALELKNEVDMNPELMKSGSDGYIKRQIENLQKTYGETDDASKVAALKTFLDRGYTYEEAAKRVINSFQNYNTTGFLFDIGAKLPVFGNPFVRFQGDLMRILKNAAIDHPVRAASTMLAWQGFTRAMSAISGETDEDRQTRESRVGSARIPFTNISLAVQTPWGELNAARLIGITAYTPVGGASVGSDLSKVLPVQSPDLRNIGSDPLIGPVLSTIADTDFRGKSIADPDQNKYTGSLLTEGEKMGNRAKYLARQYLPPTANDLTDVFAAAKGEENFYGQRRSLPQALLRLGGIKVEQYGADEAQAARDKEAAYSQSSVESKQKQISTIKNQLQRGEVDEGTAMKRINAIQGQIETETDKIMGNTGTKGAKGTVQAAGGSLSSGRVQSLNKLFDMPEPTTETGSALEKATYKTKVFKKINDVYDAEWLPESEKAAYIAQVAGISEDQAKYYGVARLTDDERTAYISDQIGGMEDAKILPYLSTLREQVNEKQILTNSVIDDLEDAGVLSDSQAKYLKKIKFNKSTGKLQYTGTEGSTAAKKALELMSDDADARRKLVDNLWKTQQGKSKISGDIEAILSATKTPGRSSGGTDINQILRKKRSFEATLGKEPQ